MMDETLQRIERKIGLLIETIGFRDTQEEMTDKILERIERKIDQLIEAIGFRLPYAQKGEHVHHGKESEGSSQQGRSASETQSR